MLTNLLFLFLKIILKSLAFLDQAYTLLRFPFLKDQTTILCQLEEKSFEKEKTKFNKKKKDTSVSIIIPFKDKWHLTEDCLKGILKQEKKNIDLHIVLIDNNSEEQKTKNQLKLFLETNKSLSIEVLSCSKPFNFSFLNNYAVKHIKNRSKFLWFLNNDISFISQNTLKNYVHFALSKERIGALSSTLLYGDKKTIQHSFLAPGIKIAGAHPLKGTLYKKTAAWFQRPRRVPAVTGASLFISYDFFINVGMFDERLAFSCQDLDLCLQLKKKGLTNWTLTGEPLIHHESLSRKHTFSEVEISYFYSKWKEDLFKFYPKLSTWNETPSLKILPFPYPWKLGIKIQNKISS